MITNTACTVYSPAPGGGYVRVALDAVFWRDTAGANIQKYGTANANTAKVLIPFDVFADGKAFIHHKSFADPETQWTIVPQKSYIIKGVTDLLIQPGQKISEILAECDWRTVMTIDTNDFGSSDMQHWEVGAK